MGSVALQSKEHRDLLDIIDKLRSKGISRYVDLPEIIVCGEQSAGKSSVLEAISGMSFPTKDNLCTRFVTELVLRPDETPGVRVSIHAHPPTVAQFSSRGWMDGLRVSL
jgi:GTP-binding protein EngB required for normal cell division